MFDFNPNKLDGAVAEKCAAPKRADVEARIRAVDELIISTSRFVEVMDEITDFIDRGPTTTTSRGVMLVGPSGVGKTTIGAHLKRRYPTIEHEEFTEIQLVECTVPANVTQKEFAETVLNKMGDPLAGTGTTQQKTDRILRFMEKCKTKVFIVDEAQAFVEHKTDERVRKTAEWFKTLVDESKVPTVLMGLEDTEHLLRTNRPLRRRFSSILRMNRYDCLESSQFQEFRSLLRAIQKQMRLEEDSELSAPATAMNIYFATDGLLGYVKKLLTAALRNALRAARARVSEADLEVAFRCAVFQDASAESNPFSRKFRARRLTQPGEPFEDEVARTTTRK